MFSSMKNISLAAILALVVGGAALISFRYATRISGTPDESSPVLNLSGSEISRTPANVTIRFHAIVVAGLGENCLWLYTPENMEQYGADPKWAINSTFGFEPGFWDRIPGTRPAIVTGKYVFVRDIQNGPCNVVTGSLFEISGIEYL